MEAKVRFPETEEGMAALQERVAEAHAAGIIRCIEQRAKDENEKKQMLYYLRSLLDKM